MLYTQATVLFVGSIYDKRSFLKSKRKIALVIAVFVVFLLAWAPWITDNYAIGKVVEKLGGPDARFNYLGEEMAVREVPTEAHWLPFCRFVTFPSEAGWFVTFWGSVV